MHVIATAGHVDHGKSTLVRALTGMEPDRLEAERRRGLTLDLGFAWTALTPGQQVIAFVDVPGHERFVSTMLAGVGPVPLVLFVVAADKGWQEQSTEHLQALHAFGVNSGVLVISRSDLADPAYARTQALEQLSSSSLAGIGSVCVSSTTGTGLDELRRRLTDVIAAVPAPDPDAPVRLWIDRVFTIRGAGTVVTGTLGAGTITSAQTLHYGPEERPAEIRGMESLERPIKQAQGLSRVALNLRGADRNRLRRGGVLLTAGAWAWTDLVDARLDLLDERPPPAEAMLHIGSATVPVRIRPLGGGFARLRMRWALPLHFDDRAVLRDPSAHRIVGGANVEDVLPPPLRRRGAPAQRATELATTPGIPAPLLRTGFIRAQKLRTTGCLVQGLLPVGGDWLADPRRLQELQTALVKLVTEYLQANPLDAGMPAESARRALALPDATLLRTLVTAPLVRRGDRIVHSAYSPVLTPALQVALEQVLTILREHPFRAPEAHRLTDLGLGTKELAAIVRAGALYAVTDGIYLLPDAESIAAEVLAPLNQPFTVSQARRALDTTRRVAVPLLEKLDRTGRTKRLPDGTRRMGL